LANCGENGHQHEDQVVDQDQMAGKQGGGPQKPGREHAPE